MQTPPPKAEFAGAPQSMSIHQFHARHDPHRPRSSWHHLLDVADSEGQVLARLREFISSFTPYEIETLPAELRPPKLMGARDVSEYGYELVQFRLAHADAPDLVHAFTDVFGYAASQLSRLASSAPVSDQESA
jgi:hypothetical protein